MQTVQQEEAATMPEEQAADDVFSVPTRSELDKVLAFIGDLEKKRSKLKSMLDDIDSAIDAIRNMVG